MNWLVMKKCHFLWALAFLYFGTISQPTNAESDRINIPTSKPIEFGLTKTKPEKFAPTKVMTPGVKSKDKEANISKAPIKAAPVIPDRKPGTITVKPLTVNFSSLTFGMQKKRYLINGFQKDPFQRSFACLSSRGQSLGTSYDLELGVMITSAIEAFTVLGIDYERPFSKIVISNNNPTNPYDMFAYDFQPHRNFEVSLGGRYYWNTQKPWFPFVGLMGTVTFQDSVRANVFAIGPNAFYPSFPPIGPLTLQGRQTLWGGTLQFGADYQFTELVSLTLVAGVRYTPRKKMTYSSIGGTQISCRDNRNIWFLPVMAALKFTF